MPCVRASIPSCRPRRSIWRTRCARREDEVIEIITATVAQARNLVDDVEWSAMDATRTSIDYLCRCVEAAIKTGATTINLPDTVGYATPDEYRHMFRAIRERVPEFRQGDLLRAYA